MLRLILFFILTLTGYTEELPIFQFPVEVISKVTKIPIEGKWAFYHRILIEPESVKKELKKIDDFKNFSEKDFSSILNNLGKYRLENVPSEWTDYKNENGQSYAEKLDHGSFLIYIKNLPKGQDLSFYSLEQGTAFEFYDIPISKKSLDENLKPVLYNGKVGDSIKESIPQIYPTINNFVNEENEHIFLVRISNFHHRQGGFWNSINIGETTKVIRQEESKKALSYFSVGVLFIMGLYHFFLFFQRKEDKSSMFFGFFCLVILIRIITIDRLVHYLFRIPSEDQFEALYRLEYISFYLGTPLFLQFIISIFYSNSNKFKNKYMNFLSWTFSVTFCISVILLPTRIFSQYIIYYHIYTLFLVSYFLILITYKLIEKVPGIIYSFTGCLVLVTFMIHDQLHANNVIQTPYIFQYGLIIFIFAQSMILSTKFALAFRESEQLNSSMSRFVPSAFLGFLKKNSLLDVNLGNAIKKELTILFLDIRGFTTLSEKLSTDDTFKLLNEVFEKLNPCIFKNKGVIDKFIGDAILALFETPEEAIGAAIEMQLELSNYNFQRRKENLSELKVGIGINTGMVTLGTVGSKDRMNTTVIGDAVNLAARLESITKEFKVEILASDKTVSKLKKEFQTRKVATVKVKGKIEENDIYEIFDFQSPEFISLKNKQKENLELALNCFKIGEFEKSKNYFEEIKKEISTDFIPDYYLTKMESVKYLKPNNWTGIQDYN